jgi:demethylmenaquinone methyltransferase/2-methoxy-6-polyprenyl-1,4-benzoquinol methylase
MSTSNPLAWSLIESARMTTASSSTTKIFFLFIVSFSLAASDCNLFSNNQTKPRAECWISGHRRVALRICGRKGSPPPRRLLNIGTFLSNMGNEFFSPGEQRAIKVNELFARIAPRYDLINDLQSLGLHRRWKRRLVADAAPQPGERALDICCGTGDLAFALAAGGAEVVGLDFNAPMLAVAARRLVSSGVGVPRFMQGDAMALPFPDAQFDIVTVGYGLRNLASWETGLHEMVRVAKPDARLLVLDFGKPDHAVWRAVYFGYLRLFVPLLGLLVCWNASAYAYILESLRHYPAQSGVAARMRELGLTQVRVDNFLGGAMSINFGVKVK